MMNRRNLVLVLIIVIAFLIRVYNFSFPFFTPDEARIASRGYALATSGKDELGRPFPLIFNSLADYQLPVVSYVTSFGELFFGKNDIGARMPFVLISILIVFLVFKIAKIIYPSEEFKWLSVLTSLFAPGLIFYSKIPNETIVLTFVIILIFYLLTRPKANFLLLISVTVIAFAVSKVAWFVVLPFIIFTLFFYQTKIEKKTKRKIASVSLVILIIVVVLFLRIPQATRSVIENNFPIISDTSLTTALNKFRGEGLQAGWPNYLEKIIFNKSQLLNVTILNWVSHFEPAILFSQFDESGQKGLIGMGVFPKILILPFVIGLFAIIRSGDKKLRALLLSVPIFTFPAFFMYPEFHQEMIIPAVPFLSFIVAFGLLRMNRLLNFLCIFLMIFEVFFNILYLTPDMKNANLRRPVWIESVIKDSYQMSLGNKVAISDNLVSDVAPYFNWYSPKSFKSKQAHVVSPYKFRETEFQGIKIIGTDEKGFYSCNFSKADFIVASRRDLEKIQKDLDIDKERDIKKIYMDSLGNKIAYLIQPTKCMH